MGHYLVSSFKDFKTYILPCFFYFLALNMTKIFHFCSVYWVLANLLFFNIPWASTTSYKILLAFMGVIFLWPVTKKRTLGLILSLLSLTFNPLACNHVSNASLLIEVYFSVTPEPFVLCTMLKKICTEL